MEILSIKRKFARVTINLFGLTISFRLKIDKKFQNKYISLGENCFVRKVLAKSGVKPKKQDGELSFPFDLSVTSLSSIAQILSNDFENFFDGLRYSNEKNIWINEDYGISYLHDKFRENEKEKLIERYEKRIENFRNLSKSDKQITFISVFLEFDSNVDDFNLIYKSLKNYFGEKKFTYVVFNFHNENNDINSKLNLNPNIIYCQQPAPFENFGIYWRNEKFKKSVEMVEFQAKFLDCVKVYD